MSLKKLNTKQAQEVLELLALGWEPGDLAPHYGVSAIEIESLAAGSQRKSKAPRRDLTPRDGESIRSRVAAGEKQSDIASEFEISQSYVSNIVKGKSLVPGRERLSAKAKAKLPLSALPALAS